MHPSVFPVYNPVQLEFERGEGMYLYDTSGKQYLDFAAGIAVNIGGHCHPHLTAALVYQASKLWHTSNMYPVQQANRLADRLVEATFADRVFFTNSGSEAIECAIKTARRYYSSKAQPHRYRIITFEGSFHGRTLGAIAASGRLEYLGGYGPPLEGFDNVPFGDLEAVRQHIGPGTAAILCEPVQGEGGIRPWSKEKLSELANIARENDLLLILDEIQCGAGRSGDMFAYEASDFTPDIVAMAKGIGGGFPLGLCLATENAVSGMNVGCHGSTFGGNPLATAVGNAVLDLILEDGFLSHVTSTGYYLMQRLEVLVKRYNKVLDARGRGLMLGLVLASDLPAAEVRDRLARDKQILVATAAGNTLRFLPPLICKQEHVDYMISGLESVLESVLDSE